MTDEIEVTDADRALAEYCGVELTAPIIAANKYLVNMFPEWDADQNLAIASGLVQATSTANAELAEARALGATILAMLGNVNHDRPGGPNDAAMRGGMLESIREAVNSALTGETK